MQTLSSLDWLMANASGPIMILYLLFMRLDKTKFMSTIAWFYFVVNLAKLPFSAQLGLINPHSLQLNALLLPVVLLGGWAGGRVTCLSSAYRSGRLHSCCNCWRWAVRSTC